MNNALTKYKFFPLFISVCLFIGMLTRVDRTFFTRNSSFNIRFIYSCLPSLPACALEPPTQSDLAALDSAIQQPFHYLGKGAHCYAFISEDKNYVIKFHRFASHMRMFPWLNRPFAYRFNEKRKKIKAYNLQKLAYNLESYKNSYQDLKEEAGLIFLHTNRTEDLKRHITLFDKTKASYRISLDDVTFILQKKADLIYPTLTSLYEQGKFEEGKQIVSSIIHLIEECCKKGYGDNDPVLRKNYGLIGLTAMHIDIGDLIKTENIEKRENYIPYVKELTESFRVRLVDYYPELLPHYYEEIERL